jgi:hypothetical protein
MVTCQGYVTLLHGAGVPAAKDYQYDETYSYEYDEDTNYDDEIPKPKVGN